MYESRALPDAQHVQRLPVAVVPVFSAVRARRQWLVVPRLPDAPRAVLSDMPECNSAPGESMTPSLCAGIYGFGLRAACAAETERG